MYPERVVKRVLTKWVADGECWISTYSVGSHGYAQVGWQKDGGVITMTTAHRVAWWGANQQPIPPGVTVDHTCHVRRCVNPAHLRLLPNSANASDNGMAAFRTNVEVGRSCRRGHPLVAQSTDGRTYCRECKAAGKRRRRAAL
jgi:HNH endonuclease